MEETKFKSGFVNIFGPPNAGKSTLMNALLGERLAIISPKVQTTRHRIMGFLTGDNYQIIFSDTPGIIDPKYKLHERMMQHVRAAVEDTDVALLMMSIKDEVDQDAEIFSHLGLHKFAILLINKIDLIPDEKKREQRINEIKQKIKIDNYLAISALQPDFGPKLIQLIVQQLPEHPPFFPLDELSDRPTKFFVSELIREQIYLQYEQEVPYHTAVLIQSFKEFPDIIKIRADIVVTREMQKRIIIGKAGSKIKQLGTEARKGIEDFLQKKVFLELFVKVRPDWRKKDIFLREYGY